MGTDFDTRKRNKRLNKRAGHEAAAEAGDKAKRDRSKGRPKVRRLCRGPCFGDPALTAEDADWRNSDDEAPAAWSAPAEDTLQPAADAGKPGRKAMVFSTSANPSAVVASAAAAEKQQRKQRDAAAAATEQSLQAAAADAAAGAAEGSGAAAGSGKRDAAPVPEALAGLPPALGRFMASQGFAAPTAIQAKVWDAALPKRKDVLAVAQPGSGKTLAYLLTLAARIMGAPPAAAGAGDVGAAAKAAAAAAEQNGGTEAEGPPAPQGLVLVPTRELAQQVAGVARKLRPAAGLRTAAVTGGAERRPQVAALQRRPQLLVATPGRLLDLLDAGALTLGSVIAVALDEADKMLSLGFAPQLQRLHALLLPPTGGKGSRQKRPQVLLCTATMPEAVAAAAATWLRKPADCRVTGGGGAAAISPTVTQVVQVCAEHKKPRKLLKHLDAVRAAAQHQRHPPRCLIFANKVKTAQFLGRLLGEHGHKAALLHGKRPQSEREEAMRDFRSGKLATLVATDVAGRGLHISSLPLVVNYDFPGNLETYVHRVGRAGRLAADGHALSFLTRNLAPLAAPLLELLQEHDQAIDPNLARLAAAYEEAVARAGGEALAAPPAEGSSEDEKEALDGAAAAGRGGSGKQPEAEDLFEGLEAIFAGAGGTMAQGLEPAAGAPDGVDDSADAGDGSGASQARRQAQAGVRGKGSRKREADRTPQLSEHRDFAKHAAKLPSEGQATGAAVSRGVSRRPIGGPVAKRRQAEAAHAPAALAATADGSPLPVANGTQRRQQAAAPNAAKSADPAADTGGLVAELEAAIGNGGRGDLYEGEDTGLFDGDGIGEASGSGGGVNKRKRGGALGGRLRKKLARQRAATKAEAGAA